MHRIKTQKSGSSVQFVEARKDDIKQLCGNRSIFLPMITVLFGELGELGERVRKTVHENLSFNGTSYGRPLALQ